MSKNMKSIFKRVISSRLVQGCYTLVHFPHHGGGHLFALYSPALHSPGLSRSSPTLPPPSPWGTLDGGANLSTDSSVRQDLTDLSEIVKEMKKEMDAQCQSIDAHRQSIGALSVPYVNIVAGEVLLWVSRVQPKLDTSSRPATLHRTRAYNVLVNSASVAEILQLKSEDYKNFLLTILGDQNNSAHWKTLDSLEKAVTDAKAMVEHFPSHVGEEQLRVLENFDKLRGLIEGGKV